MKQLQLKKQSGFAMLEVVLAIVIIAIASFGIYKLYSSSSINSKLSGEENLVSQIYNQATQMASVTGVQPTATELSSSGAFDNEVSTGGGVFKSQFGNVTYVGKDSYASIAAEKIPGSVVDQFAAHMQKWGDVYTTKKDGGSETSYPDSSYDASELYTVTVYFPKGRCTLAGDCT